jgi:hypothetical protein
MKIQVVSALLIVLYILVFSNACRFDPIDIDGNPIDTTGNPIDTTDNPGVNTCHPDTVYFSRDVLPIFVSNCAVSGCHDAITRQDGIQLTDYDKIIQTGEIEPYDLSDGDIYEKITEDDNDDRMPPPPRARLTNAQISTIAKWILQGAKNLTCDEGGCNTDNVTYSGTIAPFLQNTCNGCHSGSSAGAGIQLNTYAGVRTVALNGRLVGAVSHSSGFVPMPQGGTKINDCRISQITTWVNAGAQQN